MKTTHRLDGYFRLLIINTKLFVESFKLHTVVDIVSLLYVFGGRTQIDLTVAKGVFLLGGLLCISLMASQIIKKNAASLSFYLKLPMSRCATLAFYYGAEILPNLIAFTALYFLVRFIFLALQIPFEPLVVSQRYLHVVLAIFFIQSLTVNSMIASSFHIVFIAGYFLVLSVIYLILLIVQELVSPLFWIGNSSTTLIFLLSGYLISFIAVQKIRV